MRRIERPVRIGVTEGEFHRVEHAATLPLDACALVLLDVWDRHHVASHQERCDGVVRQAIVPLLECARASGMAVIHAPGAEIAAKFGADCGSGNRWLGECEGSPWPPGTFRDAAGEWDWLGGEPVPDAVCKLREARTIHPAVLPRGDESIVSGGESLQRELERRQTLFVFFAGFAANICMLYRDYGMRAVRGWGYQVVLLRDATAAIEYSESCAAQESLRGAIADVEMNVGWSATARALAMALR